MDARQIIENQQELIDLLREKIERLEAENKAAYGLAAHIAHTLMPDNRSYTYAFNDRWNVELLFEKALEQIGTKQTSYRFVTREVDAKYLRNGGKS